MGDKTTKSDSQVTEKSIGSSKTGSSTLSNRQSNNKDSIDCLHESKPAPNISINATIYEKNEDESMMTASSLITSTTSPARIETVYEKLSAVSEQSEPSNSILNEDQEKSVNKDSSITEINNKQINDTNDSWRGSGSYGKLNKQRDLASSIFPVGCMGCKEQEQTSPRRFIDAKEAAQDFTGHIDMTPRKRPSSAKPQNSRNPLTGDGIEDDVKKTNNRKKGNS